MHDRRPAAQGDDHGGPKQRGVDRASADELACRTTSCIPRSRRSAAVRPSRRHGRRAGDPNASSCKRRCCDARRRDLPLADDPPAPPASRPGDRFRPWSWGKPRRSAGDVVGTREQPSKRCANGARIPCDHDQAGAPTPRQRPTGRSAGHEPPPPRRGASRSALAPAGSVAPLAPTLSQRLAHGSPSDHPLFPMPRAATCGSWPRCSPLRGASHADRPNMLVCARLCGTIDP